MNIDYTPSMSTVLAQGQQLQVFGTEGIPTAMDWTLSELPMSIISVTSAVRRSKILDFSMITTANDAAGALVKCHVPWSSCSVRNWESSDSLCSWEPVQGYSLRYIIQDDCIVFCAEHHMPTILVSRDIFSECSINLHNRTSGLFLQYSPLVIQNIAVGVSGMIQAGNLRITHITLSSLPELQSSGPRTPTCPNATACGQCLGIATDLIILGIIPPSMIKRWIASVRCTTASWPELAS